MKFLLITAFFLFLFACNKLDKIEQPTVLETGKPLDISLINFKESIPLLFSKAMRIDGARLDSAEWAKFDYNTIAYTIEKAGYYDLKVPQTPYGYVFHAYDDSLMRLDSFYFDEVNILTAKDTTFSALYAVSEFRNKRKLNAQIRAWKRKYGKPSLEVYLGREFNICAYEWVLEDRIIQVETSHGFSFGTDTADNGKYYKVELLLVKKSELEKLRKAHTYHFSATEDFKKFGMEQDQLFPDDYLLNSTFPHFKNDSMGIYNIEQADTLE
jgi:hypothetical protein